MHRTYIKRLAFVRMKKSLSHEEFIRYWLTTHAELCKKLPGVKRYSVNLIDRAQFADLDYDGFSELWFDTEHDFDRAMRTPEGIAVLADLPNFTDAIYPLIAVEHPQL